MDKKKLIIYIIGSLMLAGLLYLFALNGRYSVIVKDNYTSVMIFDKWEKEILIHGEKELPYPKK